MPSASSLYYQKAYFLLSAAETKQLPQDAGIEVAIVGRSNAGKSSVLNNITKNKSLARVSKTPGRTQLINVFVLDDNRRLVDLPGYGFAKVPLATKQKWEKIVDRYIATRKALKGLILVMDGRHPLKPLDWQLLTYCQHRPLDVHILLNKSDKLSKHERARTLKMVQAELIKHDINASVQNFSAANGEGLKELYQVLGRWYERKD